VTGTYDVKRCVFVLTRGVAAGARAAVDAEGARRVACLVGGGRGSSMSESDAAADTVAPDAWRDRNVMLVA